MINKTQKEGEKVKKHLHLKKQVSIGRKNLLRLSLEIRSWEIRDLMG
jgi:hypothetical protein